MTTTTSRNDRQGKTGRRVALVLLVSLLFHIGLIVWVGPHLRTEPEPEARDEFVVETRYEEDEQVVEEEPPVEPVPQPEPEPEVVEIPEPPEPEPEPDPVEPDYREDDERAPQAMDIIPPTPEEEPETTEVAETAEEPPMDPVILEKPKPDPTKLLMPDPSAYDRVFAAKDVEASERAEKTRQDSKKRLFPGYEALSKNVRSSLINHGHEVRVGNHQGVDSKSGGYASYVGLIHHKIHERWANNYLIDLDLHEPGGSPMNNPQLNTKLEFVISAQDGTVESVNIVRSSGQLRFDAQAIAIAHQIGPHPNPPPALVSPNGKVYMHWNFWRDQRQCGPFGASVFIVNSEG